MTLDAWKSDLDRRLTDYMVDHPETAASPSTWRSQNLDEVSRITSIWRRSRKITPMTEDETSVIEKIYTAADCPITMETLDHVWALVKARNIYTVLKKEII